MSKLTARLTLLVIWIASGAVCLGFEAPTDGAGAVGFILCMGLFGLGIMGAIIGALVKLLSSAFP